MSFQRFAQDARAGISTSFAIAVILCMCNVFFPSLVEERFFTCKYSMIREGVSVSSAVNCPQATKGENFSPFRSSTLQTVLRKVGISARGSHDHFTRALVPERRHNYARRNYITTSRACLEVSSRQGRRSKYTPPALVHNMQVYVRAYACSLT